MDRQKPFHFRPSDYVGKKIDPAKLNGYKYRFYPVGDHDLPQVKIIALEGIHSGYNKPLYYVLSICLLDEYSIYSTERVSYVVLQEARWDGGWYDEFSETAEQNSAELLTAITFGSKRSMGSYLLSAAKCQRLLTDMFVKYPSIVTASTENILTTIEPGHWRITCPNPDYQPDLMTDVYYESNTGLIKSIGCRIEKPECKGKVNLDSLVGIVGQIRKCAEQIIPEGGKTDFKAHSFSKLYYQENRIGIYELST